MDDRLIVRRDGGTLRRLRWAAKALARLSFIAILLSGAVQGRSVSRVGGQFDWTYFGPALIVFGLAMAALSLFWTRDALRNRAR